jgi:integrase
VVLTGDEVKRILQQLDGVYWLLASLLYGTGMRVTEGIMLRVTDIDMALAICVPFDNPIT